MFSKLSENELRKLNKILDSGLFHLGDIYGTSNWIWFDYWDIHNDVKRELVNKMSYNIK